MMEYALKEILASDIDVAGVSCVHIPCTSSTTGISSKLASEAPLSSSRACIDYYLGHYFGYCICNVSCLASMQNNFLFASFVGVLFCYSSKMMSDTKP